MRILLRSTAAIVALLVVAAVGALLLLPRLLESDSLRERIGAAAEEALGRDVDYGRLGFAWFPPAVVVEQIRVAGETPEAPPLLEGEELALHFSLLPLLARTLVIDSLSLRGATGTLIRTDTGFSLPSPASAARAPAAGEGAAAPGGAAARAPIEDGGAAIDLAVARVELLDARFLLEDRRISPAVRWDLRELEANARATAADEPVALDFSFVLASGGRVRGAGDATLDGALDLSIEFEEVPLAQFAPYVDAGSKLAGTLSGTAQAVGPAASLEALRIEARLSDGRFELDDLTIVGPVKLAAALHGPVAAPRGSFEIDATDAEVRYGGMFTKPPGDAATVEGRLVDGPGGKTAIDDIRFKVRNFKGTASVEGGARPRVVVNAAPFDLAGWGASIPALAPYSPAGPVAFESLGLRFDPLEIRGRILLPDLRLSFPDTGEVALRGALVGTGTTLASEELVLVAADQTIAVDARIDELDGGLRFRVKSSARDVDANRLVGAFASKPDFAFGLLAMNGDLHGSLAGGRPPLETLAGSARIDVGAGRLAGVSLLKLMVNGFDGIGSLAVIASRMFGGPNLQPFYGDEFLGISGNFEVDGGVVRTSDFQLVYPDYQVDLRGTLQLHDLGIDMRGVLTLGEALAAELGRGEAAPGSRRIDLAHVTGTLDDPDVRVSREVAAAFLEHSGLQQKAGEALGDAVGGEVGDLLEGLFGGSRPR